MKKKWLLWIILILIAGGAGFWWTHRSRNTRDATSTRVVQAELGTVEDTVETTGEVAPLNRVEIKPPVQGRIEKILVDEGSTVKQGDVLAWMSSSDRAAILDAARSQGPDAIKKWGDTYKPTPIIAPLNGIIILRNIVVGQTVDMSTVLFALSDKLIVLGHVDEVDIGRVRKDMPARITLDSYPDMAIPGHVVSILYEGVNTSNVITYGVKVYPEKVPPFFRSQMTANISFIASRKENVVLVPSAAVKDTREGQKMVLVPGPDNKPVPKTVTTGLENGDKIEIVSGLAVGDSIVISQKRYKPQQAASSSPLVMGGPKQPQAGGARQGGGRSSGGGGR